MRYKDVKVSELYSQLLYAELAGSCVHIGYKDVLTSKKEVNIVN